MSNNRFVIDTDAGVDDAHALMMALAQPDIQVEAITTLTGNIEVQQVNRNVFTVLDVMQRDIPVHQGADRPLVKTWRWETEAFHGSDGLGDWPQRPPTSRRVEPEHAVATLIRLANTYPGELNLVALGPLTNLALAVRLDPDLPRKIRKLVFMGGAVTGRGNTVMPAAEFNIYCDPEAAYIVLDAFSHAAMISWEATLEHPLPWAWYQELLRLPGAKAQFFKATNERVLAGQSTYLLPDPLAMAVALCPEIILQSDHHRVMVELRGTLTRGQTVIDYANKDCLPHNAEVIKRIDIDKVYQLFRQMLTP
jgi:purine nucleosidase